MKSIHVRLESEQYEWLRRYCFENRVAQAEVIREALDIFKNQKGEEEMKLRVIDRAASTDDFSIGYLNGKPAIGAEEAWYLVGDDNVVIHNRYDGYVWYIEDGAWRSTHESNWVNIDKITDDDQLTAGGPDWVEED